MKTTETEHAFSQEVQTAIYEAIKPDLDRLAAVKKDQTELDNRIEHYSNLQTKTEQDIFELQTAIINGGKADNLKEITALKLNLESIDDIVLGVKENRAKLSKEYADILDAIGNKTNAAYNNIKVRFQKMINEEAVLLMEQLENKLLALKKNLSPSSFVPELKGVHIKNLNTHRHQPYLLKLPESFRDWV